MLHSLSCAEAREHSLSYLSKLGTQISHLCFQTAFLIQDSIEFCFTSMEENFQILDATLSHRQICIFLLVAGKKKKKKKYIIFMHGCTPILSTSWLQLQVFLLPDTFYQAQLITIWLLQ